MVVLDSFTSITLEISSGSRFHTLHLGAQFFPVEIAHEVGKSLKLRQNKGYLQEISPMPLLQPDKQVYESI